MKYYQIPPNRCTHISWSSVDFKYHCSPTTTVLVNSITNITSASAMKATCSSLNLVSTPTSWLVKSDLDIRWLLHDVPVYTLHYSQTLHGLSHVLLDEQSHGVVYTMFYPDLPLLSPFLGYPFAIRSAINVFYISWKCLFFKNPVQTKCKQFSHLSANSLLFGRLTSFDADNMNQTAVSKSNGLKM